MLKNNKTGPERAAETEPRLELYVSQFRIVFVPQQSLEH